MENNKELTCTEDQGAAKVGVTYGRQRQALISQYGQSSLIGRKVVVSKSVAINVLSERKVVNGWGEILEEGNSGVRVVNAGCLAFISNVAANNEGARLYIDPVIEDFKACHKMIFPINPYGRHWAKEYVEDKIVEFIARDNCETVFKKSGAIETVLDAPQQSYGSVDCGIIVCIIIERLVLGHNPTASISLSDVGKFRRKMARVFVERGAAHK